MAKRKAVNRGRKDQAAGPAKSSGGSARPPSPAGKARTARGLPAAKPARAKRPASKPTDRPADSSKPQPAAAPGNKAPTVKPAGAQTASSKPPAPKTGGNQKRPGSNNAAELLKTPREPGRNPASPVSERKNGRSAGRAVETEMDDAPLRKTPLTDAELAEFRELLLEKRRELVGDVNNMTDEARRSGSPGGTVSSMPIHMADLGSDTWEQELTLGLIENERGLLREIDEALTRIENKTYGICIAMNKPIGKARLRFKPWAKYCIEHARKVELGRG